MSGIKAGTAYASRATHVTSGLPTLPLHISAMYIDKNNLAAKYGNII